MGAPGDELITVVPRSMQQPVVTRITTATIHTEVVRTVVPEVVFAHPWARMHSSAPYLSDADPVVYESEGSSG